MDGIKYEPITRCVSISWSRAGWPRKMRKRSSLLACTRLAPTHHFYHHSSFYITLAPAEVFTQQKEGIGLTCGNNGEAPTAELVNTLSHKEAGRDCLVYKIGTMWVFHGQLVGTWLHNTTTPSNAALLSCWNCSFPAISSMADCVFATLFQMWLPILHSTAFLLPTSFNTVTSHPVLCSFCKCATDSGWVVPQLKWGSREMPSTCYLVHERPCVTSPAVVTHLYSALPTTPSGLPAPNTFVFYM